MLKVHYSQKSGINRSPSTESGFFLLSYLTENNGVNNGDEFTRVRRGEFTKASTGAGNTDQFNS